MRDDVGASLGIVVALLAEAKALGLRRPQSGQQAGRQADSNRMILVSGMGADAAGRAATALADAGVAALLSFGTAGGLDPALVAGSLICPLRVQDEDGQVFTADAGWRARLQARTAVALTDGAMLSVSRPLMNPDAKRAAHALSGAVAVDLESAAIASVSRARGLPFLALRAVVDDARSALPEAVLASTDAYGRARLPALLVALLKSPEQALQLPRLARAFGQATAALRIINQAAPDFGWRQ